ncbi:MAG: hypothetical protein J6B09_04195 [Clostridia bacterium]|nr:hypothetical protein [Clostridia bacterium]
MIAHWIIFSLIIPLVPFSLAYVFVKFGKTNEWSEKEKRIVGMTVVKNTMYFWLLDFFYMSCFTGWFLGKYIFGILAILFVFVNLTNAFLAKSNISKWSLLVDFLVGVALSIYLILIIPDPDFQLVVTTIIAAVYSGLLTLVGVAWTIKKGDDNRQADFKRIDDERKEEERKKHIPFLKVAYEKATSQITATMGADLALAKEVILQRPSEGQYCDVDIPSFNIKNVSDSNVILLGMNIDNRYYKFEENLLLEKGLVCAITPQRNMLHLFVKMPEKIELIVSDVLENRYTLLCKFSISKRTGPQTLSSPAEVITYIPYQYTIESVSLPQLIKASN